GPALPPKPRDLAPALVGAHCLDVPRAADVEAFDRYGVLAPAERRDLADVRVPRGRGADRIAETPVRLRQLAAGALSHDVRGAALREPERAQLAAHVVGA